MPRIHRVLETALYCDHLDRTAAFYLRFFGTPLLRSERLVAFDAGGGTVLLLFQRGQSSRPLPTSGGVIPPHDGSGPSHVAFAVATGSVVRLHGHEQMGIHLGRLTVEESRKLQEYLLPLIPV